LNTSSRGLDQSRIKTLFCGGKFIMALYIYQPGVQPLGQFDVVNTDLASIKGGEVGTLTAVTRTNTSSESAAFDVLDGYTNVSDVKRVAITTTVSASTFPLWLLDEGTTGYGTLFGQVIGTPVGLSATGTNLGPHTAAASGKVTCWDKPGLYAVSVDAVDTNASTGLTLTNSSCVPGVAVTASTAGVLTQSTGGNITTTVGRFVEFETSPFLVTTPASLVGATEAAVRVVIAFNPEVV
jgi:hypothetical protein